MTITGSELWMENVLFFGKNTDKLEKKDFNHESGPN